MMPFIWKTYEAFAKQPPIHLLVRDYLGYKPGPSKSEMSALEAGILKHTGMASFDSMPDFVQVQMLKDLGYRTVDEYKAKLRAQAN